MCLKSVEIWVVSRILMMTGHVSNKLLKDGGGRGLGLGVGGSFKVKKAMCVSTDVSLQGSPSSSFLAETRNMPNLNRLGANGSFHNICCCFFLSKEVH